MNSASAVRLRAGVVGVIGVMVLAGGARAQYLRHDLVSSVPGAADHTDPGLINSWGIAFNPTGVVWVSPSVSHCTSAPLGMPSSTL